MKAAVLHAVNQPMTIEEVGLQKPGPREVLIRTAVAQIREMGRSTQGVTLIALSEGEKLAGIARIEDRDEDGNGGNGSGENGEPPAPSTDAGLQGQTIH